MTERTPAQDLVDLYDRWGIGVDRDELFDQFKHRFLVALQVYVFWDRETHTAVLRRLAIIRGFGSSTVAVGDALDATRNLNEFLLTAQQVLWAIRDANSVSGYAISAVPFAVALEDARDHSPMIDFLLVPGEAGPTILAAGATELDVPLVAETLAWLAPHKTIAAKFENVLRTVLAKDPVGYRGALDELRWSLEQLLRVVLENERPIEDQKAHLSRWLKERGVHQAIVQLYVDLLKHFADYQNDAVKHDEKWSEDELEFMIYLTGSFMRLLLRQSVKDATAAPGG